MNSGFSSYSIIIFRGFGFGQKFCEDVTVNDCNIGIRNPKVIRATPNINKEQCQAICDAETDCAVFRFEKQTGKCSRFDRDYRQECISGGGPAVNNYIMYLYNQYLKERLIF